MKGAFVVVLSKRPDCGTGQQLEKAAQGASTEDSAEVRGPHATLAVKLQVVNQLLCQLRSLANVWAALNRVRRGLPPAPCLGIQCGIVGAKGTVSCSKGTRAGALSWASACSTFCCQGSGCRTRLRKTPSRLPWIIEQQTQSCTGRTNCPGPCKKSLPLASPPRLSRSAVDQTPHRILTAPA